MSELPLMKAALTIATTSFTIVGLVSAALLAILAIRLFWRAIVALLAAATFIAYPDTRLMLTLAGGGAFVGWGWERWRRNRTEGARALQPLAQRA